MEGLLSLYQTQIDFDSYLLVKEPYTDTLRKYLEVKVDFEMILVKLEEVFEKMYSEGFYLYREVQLEDFVMVFDEIKVQNVGIFTLGG